MIPSESVSAVAASGDPQVALESDFREILFYTSLPMLVFFVATFRSRDTSDGSHHVSLFSNGDRIGTAREFCIVIFVESLQSGLILLVVAAVIGIQLQAETNLSI
jgi:hypothetical protein